MKTNLLKHSLCALLCLGIAVLSSCSSDEVAVPAAQRSLKVRLSAMVRPFDAGSSTRSADDWKWNDGDVIFLRFKSGDNFVRGRAVYSATDDTWEIPSWEGMLAAEGTCELVYVDGAAVTDQEQVVLTPSMGVYSDEAGSYTVTTIGDVTEVTVEGKLVPTTSRVRFAGTPGVTIDVSGLTAYTAFDATNGVLSSSSSVISLTVGTEGFTPYVYGVLTDASKRQLSISNSVDGGNIQFVRSFLQTAFKVGESGYVTIPMSGANRGWDVVEGSDVSTLTFSVHGVLFNMKLVEAGTFQMGSETGSDDEKPVHQVTLTKDYYMGETEVTQALWYAVMGQSPTANGSQWTADYGLGDQFPAYSITYNDCQAFLDKLNQLTGQAFRFPTEAEWEFAARGGNKSKGYTYAGSNAIGDVAWYTANSDSTNHPVALKMPNELGLYDMSGNVYEWCSDWYGEYTSTAQTDPTGAISGSNRVRRGGSRYNPASNCRVSKRNSNMPSYRGSGYGFRLTLGEVVIKEDSLGLCPDSNHPHAIDLGLGVKFACCNVGADSPADNGDYFAWGETSIKDNYVWSTYTLSEGSNTTLTKYCNQSKYGTVDEQKSLVPEDDVAYAKWKGNWRMPTIEEFSSLSSHCTLLWITLGGNAGYKVTAPNGKSIFLPAAGTRAGTTLNNEGSFGSYWSSSLDTSAPSSARTLNFINNGELSPFSHDGRQTGRSVRPVLDETSERTFMVSGVSFKMKKVKAGTFQMGSASGEENEKPIHTVTLTKDYYMGKTEVTNALWKAVTGSVPSQKNTGDSYPVEYISYEDCQSFLTELNQLTGQNFRFPMEAEWEFAAKGGTQSQGYTYAGSNTIGDVAWYYENSSSTTHPVAQKAPNELGLYDMSGNVWEWCYDWYGSYSSSAQTDPMGATSSLHRVLRGGSWFYNATRCSVASRNSASPTNHNFCVGHGFRLAL